MTESLEIQLRTLTPIWTGGVDGRVDRIHETGIIGSLRWWYEIIVRGLGGYVSNPVADASGLSDKVQFDSKAYEEAKRDGETTDEALKAGFKPLCLVTYLFGTTGWARLFQLQILDAPITPLHFVTSLSMNKGWLERIFGGESQSIIGQTVPYGDVRLRLTPRGYDQEYAMKQVLLALYMAAEYGGIGARLQHGFGQVDVNVTHRDESFNLQNAMNALNARLIQWPGPKLLEVDPSPFNLRYFVSHTYKIPRDRLPQCHITVGTKPTRKPNYIPCAFDLRYKGSGRLGMRRWLEEKMNWKSSNDPKQLGRLDELMGPRAKWGTKGQEKQIDDELRTASRIFFSMPYRIDDQTYQLRIFGFAPSNILTPHELSNLFHEYMEYAFNLRPDRVVLGLDLISLVQGASS